MDKKVREEFLNVVDGLAQACRRDQEILEHITQLLDQIKELRERVEMLEGR